MKGGHFLETLTGLALAAWLVWTLLASTPNERFDRACAPVQWTESVALSAAAFIHPTGEVAVKGAMDKADYFCRYTTWQLFYGKEYERWKSGQPGGGGKS